MPSVKYKENMFSLSEENYLKAIFHLERSSSNGVSTNALAEKMEAKASSVTDMIKKLAGKQLVEYKKYQGVKLSGEGKETAVDVIRKHRLWEYFLVEKLNFSWDEVHEVAEQLEHIKSEKLIKELDRFLEYPKYDPHGDPIPDSEGNFQTSERLLLAELEPKERGICVGVKNSSADFLQYLDKNGMSLGKNITVIEKEPFDQSVVIELDGQEQRISNLIAANLFIKIQ